jgi:4-amino-4-deoxy-L-arabinose transferase-like glycosyltransferase
VEWEAILLVGMVAGFYFLRLPDMSVRGEESRWATVAMEMTRAGDWVVPRQQGVPFLSRPPLGSWLIAVCSQLRGECDIWAIRLPTVIATLLTSLMVYGYARIFLSPLGAFTAGIAYATMGQVLQLGRVAETEAVFTLFVASSLLVWHWGYVQEWRRVWPWVAGYALAALGALAKGPQAPIYFVAATGMFLLLQRDWRRLVSWHHLAGISIFFGIIASWQIPFFLKMDWPAVQKVWASDTAMRIWEINPLAVAKHLVTYPMELVACTMPWSLFLGIFLTPGFRRTTGLNQLTGVKYRPVRSQMVSFLLVCLAVTFPSCWLIPGAHGRYYMPLFPCMAPLVGLAVEQLVIADPESKLHRIWQSSLIGMSVVMVAMGLIVLSASWLGFPSVSMLIQERTFSLFYATGAIILSALLWLQTRRITKTPPTLRPPGLVNYRSWIAVLSLAGFMGLTYDGLVMNFIVRKNGVTAEQVALLRNKLPEGELLVSFGPIHHLFAYHFREPTPLKDWPPQNGDPNLQPEYFCFDWNYKQPIPFAWEEIARVSCDRDRSDHPEEVVTVGRRLISMSRPKSDME